MYTYNKACFQKKSESEYIGELRFTQEMYLINPVDTTSFGSFQYLINILAIKSQKSFGDKTEYVWEVFLGEIKI